MPKKLDRHQLLTIIDLITVVVLIVGLLVASCCVSPLIWLSLVLCGPDAQALGGTVTVIGLMIALLPLPWLLIRWLLWPRS